MSETNSFYPPAFFSDAHPDPSYISAEAVDADVLLPPPPDGHVDDDEASLLSEGEEDFDLPAAPPGCRWLVEAPDGTLVDPAVEIPSAASAVSCETRELVREAEKRLRLTFTGSTDSICCSSMFFGKEKFGGNCLLALGCCDDACRLYLFSPELQAGQQGQATREVALSVSVSQGDNETGGARDPRSLPHPGAKEKQLKPPGTAQCSTAVFSPVTVNPVSVLTDGKDTISSVTFSFDGTLVACGCFDGNVRVYRLIASQRPASHGEADRSPPHSSPPAGPLPPVHAPPVQETESHFPACSRQSGFSSFLVETLRGPSADVTDAVFHPRGYALLAASADRTAWVWLIPASLARRKPDDAPECSREKPDGSSRRDLVPTAQALSVFVAAAPLTSCAYTGDGKLCLVGAEDGTLSVFNPKSGEAILSLQHPAKEPAALAPAVRAHVPLRNRGTKQNGDEEGAGSASVVCLRLFSVGGSGGEERIVCVGYEDGWILVLHENSGKVVVSAAAHSGHSVEAIELVGAGRGEAVKGSSTPVVEPSGNQHWLVTGGLDGFVLVWDITRRTVKHSISINSLLSRRKWACRNRVSEMSGLGPGSGQLDVKECGGDDRQHASEEDAATYEEVGVTKILAHPRGLPIACVGTTDGQLLLVDVRTGEGLSVWAAHEGAIMEIQHVSAEVGESNKDGVDQDFWGIVTAGDDGAGKAWAVQPLAELARNVQERSGGQ